MLRLNGIEAWISGEDKSPFEAYGVERDATTGAVSCYIAYEPGMNFAIRWRDLDSSVDIGGFVTIDGSQYGGRLIKSKSYAPAVFSRIQTSSTYSRPLSFPSHSPAHHVRTPLGGTITLDIHVVTSGETRIHEGLSDLAAQRLYCCSQSPQMASLLPSSSTEVASLGKIATFVFRYRTLNFLRAYGLAPVERIPYAVSAYRTTSPQIGDKRSASSLESDLDDEDGSSLSPHSIAPPFYIATPKTLEVPHLSSRSHSFYTTTPDARPSIKRLRT